MAVRLPPLRERPEDIPLLAEHFLARLRRLRPELRPWRSPPRRARRSRAHRWPGNVRELEHAIERAVVLAEGPEIGEDDLRTPSGSGRRARPPAPPGGDLSLKRATHAVEAQVIRAALERTGGNRTRAAELLEISYRALLYKIKDYGLS